MRVRGEFLGNFYYYYYRPFDDGFAFNVFYLSERHRRTDERTFLDFDKHAITTAVSQSLLAVDGTYLARHRPRVVLPTASSLSTRTSPAEPR